MSENRFPDSMTSPSIALAFGVSRQAVNAWDCPSRNAPGRKRTKLYNLPEVIAWRLEKIQEECEARAMHTMSPAELDAVQRKRTAEAIIKEAQAAEVLGLFVRAEDVQQQWERVLLVFRQKLEGLGATMAKKLEQLPANEVAAILNERMTDLMTELIEDYQSGGPQDGE